MTHNRIPEVSVIIPVWNSADYIQETLHSVLNQTFSDMEVLVIDNGSEDATVSRTMEITDPRLRLIPLEKNRGAGAARQTGLEQAKGRWIQYLDGDDLLDSGKIEQQVQHLREHPDSVAFGNVCFFWDGDQYLDSRPEANANFYYSTDHPLDFLLNLYGRNGAAGMIPIHSWLSPKKVLNQAGPWNPDISVDDDGEYFCRVLLQAESVIFEPDARVYYRKFKTRSSLSLEKNRKGMESIFLATELKYQACRASNRAHPDVDPVFAQYFMEQANLTWPEFPDITQKALKRVQDLGGTSHVPLIGNPILNHLKTIFGWKAMKWVSWQKNKLLQKFKRL